MTARPAEPSEQDQAAQDPVAQALALDDYLGGFTATETAAVGPPQAPPDAAGSGNLAGLVDTILLLRQAAAADGAVPVPGAAEMPTIRIDHTETPSPHTRHGIKGVGEGGAIAPPAAILNAVNAALAEFGVEFAETPLTPRRLLGGLLARRAAVGGGA